jgi:arginine/lysine/ornithine decarboxylase
MFTLESCVAISDSNGPEWDVTVSGYIIPYPPGVPLAVPGDRLTDRVIDDIVRLGRAGVPVFFINN